MDLNTIRLFFMWCSIINVGLFLVSFLVLAYAGGWVHRMHSRWFPMPRETFNVAVYAFLGAMKLFVLLANVVPYVVLEIIS